MFKISMMLLQNSVGTIFETEHICPSLLRCEIRFHGISDGALSLANALNKRDSNLVTDQTAAACHGRGQA